MDDPAANATLTLIQFVDELPAAVRAHAVAMFFVWIVVVPLASLLPLLFRGSKRKGWVGVYIPVMMSALGVTGYAINRVSTFKSEGIAPQHFNSAHAAVALAALSLAGITSLLGCRPGCSRTTNYLQITAFFGRSAMFCAAVATLLGLSRVQDLFGSNEQVTMLQIGVGAYAVSAAMLMSALSYYIGYAPDATTATAPGPLLAFGGAEGDDEEEVALRLAATREIAYPFPPRGAQGRMHAAGALGGGPGELRGPASPQGAWSRPSSSSWAPRSPGPLRSAFRKSISYFRDSAGKNRAPWGGAPTATLPDGPSTAPNARPSDGKNSFDVPQASAGEAHAAAHAVAPPPPPRSAGEAHAAAHAVAPPLPPRKHSSPPSFPQPPAILTRKLSSLPELLDGPGPSATTQQRQFQRNKLRIAKEADEDATAARQDGASWA